MRDFGREGRLRLAEYHKLGGIQGSIEAVVASALAEPGRSPAIPVGKEAQLAALRAAFIPWLARIDPETGTPMRRVAHVDEIPEGSRAVVERLVAARLLKPLGNPPPHSVKYFAASELLEQLKDRAWLAKVTNALNQHWQRKNAAKRESSPVCLNRQITTV